MDSNSTPNMQDPLAVLIEGFLYCANVSYFHLSPLTVVAPISPWGTATGMYPGTPNICLQTLFSTRSIHGMTHPSSSLVHTITAVALSTLSCNTLLQYVFHIISFLHDLAIIEKVKFMTFFANLIFPFWHSPKHNILLLTSVPRLSAAALDHYPLWNSHAWNRAIIFGAYVRNLETFISAYF